MKAKCWLLNEDPFWQGAKQWYYNWLGVKLNYKNPKNMNEKLMWLSRYWQDPRKTECADKILVRDYVKKSGFEEILLPIYGIWNNANEINFEALPEQFVLKCNHGCGYNIICKERKSLDKDLVKNQLNKWIGEVYGKAYYEIHYAKIKPRIFCEKYLPSIEKSVIDYKIHCINGKPYCFLICSDRDDSKNEITLSSYSLDWKHLNLLKKEGPKDIPMPKNLKKMVNIATVLSKPFPYVRIDLYEIEGVVYFGELTFTPHGNIMDYYKDEVLLEMGRLLKLPEKYNN